MAKAAKKARQAAPEFKSSKVGQTIDVGGPIRFVAKKAVTVPQLKQREGETVVVRFEGAMYRSQALKPKPGSPAEKEAGKDKRVMEPPMVAHVIDGKTGEEKTYIVAAVVQSELEQNYPDGAYVGKWFSITMHPKREGKRYRDYTITEVEEG